MKVIRDVLVRTGARVRALKPAPRRKTDADDAYGKGSERQKRRPDHRPG